MNLENFLSVMYEETRHLNENGRNSEAIFTAEQLSVQSLNTLGLTYCANKFYQKAIDAFRYGLKIDAGNWLLWSNIAHAYSLQEKHTEALEASLNSIKFSDGQVFDPYYNTGVILHALNRIKEAAENYELALKIKPDSKDTNYNLGLLKLRQGLDQDGWEKYEWRFKTSELTKRFKERFLQPHWDGRKFKNKTLLVYSEQGLGDFIFYSRFLPIVKEMGGNIICEIQEPLVPLIGKNLKIDEVRSRPNNIDWPKAPDTDYCISVCSLPRVLKINLFEQIPKDPYIIIKKKAPLPEIKKCKKLKVGFCWCGNPDHPRDHTRSISLEKFRKIGEDPKIQLFGLVKGVSGKRNWPSGSVDLNQGIESFPMIDLSPKIENFKDLAEIIQHLDLVITVDTGLAHLAGAMGKPIWTVLGKEIDWRWMDNTDSSPWYPSMKLFRYKNSWEETLDQCHAELSRIDWTR